MEEYWFKASEAVRRRARTALFRYILGSFRPFGARREIPNGNAYRWNLVKPSDLARGTGASEKPHDVGGPNVDKGSHPDRFVHCSARVRCLPMVFRFPDAHCCRGSLPNAKSTRCKGGSCATHGFFDFPVTRQEALVLWV